MHLHFAGAARSLAPAARLATTHGDGHGKLGAALGLGTVNKIASVVRSPAGLAVAMSMKQTLVTHRRRAKVGGSHVPADVTDIVDLAICLASILGSMTIIVPYIVNRRSRKLRHALILGLATSDLVSRYVHSWEFPCLRMLSYLLVSLAGAAAVP